MTVSDGVCPWPKEGGGSRFGPSNFTTGQSPKFEILENTLTCVVLRAAVGKNETGVLSNQRYGDLKRCAEVVENCKHGSA